MNSRALVLSTLLMASASLPAFADKAAEEAAQQSAQKWLALADANKYGQTWDTAASYFKKSVPKKSWEKQIGAVRGALGKVESRQLKSATYSKQLPGAPDGEYVVIQYTTSFEKKKSAIETITPMMDGGSWKVSGYFIK